MSLFSPPLEEEPNARVEALVANLRNPGRVDADVLRQALLGAAREGQA